MRAATEDAEAQAAASAGRARGRRGPGGSRIRARRDRHHQHRPDGCAIWVDGDLRSEVTPARIEKLPLGKEIKLKLTREGFEAFRSDVTLTEAQPTEKIDAEMSTGSAAVILKIEPPATVWLDGKPWKGDRGKVDGLSAGEEHKIVVSASGYQPRTFTVTAAQGETKTITESLVKAEPGAAPPASTKADAPAGAPAKVRVSSKPGFCNVTVNGTTYGPTPVRGGRAPPGSGARLVQAGERPRAATEPERSVPAKDGAGVVQGRRVSAGARAVA